MTVPSPQHIAITDGALTPGSDVHMVLTMPDESTATARGFFAGVLRTADDRSLRFVLVDVAGHQIPEWVVHASLFEGEECARLEQLAHDPMPVLRNRHGDLETPYSLTTGYQVHAARSDPSNVVLEMSSRADGSGGHVYFANSELVAFAVGLLALAAPQTSVSRSAPDRADRVAYACDGSGFVVAAAPDVVDFAVDAEAFDRWFEDLGAYPQDGVPDRTDDRAAHSLSEMVLDAIEDGVLVSDPRLELEVHDDDDADGSGYYVLVSSRAGAQSIVRITTGWTEMHWPPPEATVAEQARYFMDAVVSEANALLRAANLSAPALRSAPRHGVLPAQDAP